METNQLTSREEYTNLYCHLANTNDTIQVIEWPNGEGVDIFITASNPQYFSLTYGQLELIEVLTKIKEHT